MAVSPPKPKDPHPMLIDQLPSAQPAPVVPSPHPSGDTELSPRLYNRDLAPTKKQGRRWSGYSIFTLWANDVHSLGNYGFALGLFALGLGGWQILLALGIGAALLFVLLTISGYMGYHTGVPLPWMSRIALGVRVTHLTAIIRGGGPIVWFGIQPSLASRVLRVLLIAVVP